MTGLGLEIIDPTTDAVVFGDANLSFALNLARHSRLTGDTSGAHEHTPRRPQAAWHWLQVVTEIKCRLSH